MAGRGSGPRARMLVLTANRWAVMAASPSGEAWAEQRSTGLLHPSSSFSCFVLAVVGSCLLGSSSNGSR